MGYQIVMTYDQIDGYRFSDEESPSFVVSEKTPLPDSARDKVKEIIKFLITTEDKHTDEKSSEKVSRESNRKLRENAYELHNFGDLSDSDDSLLSSPPRKLPDQVNAQSGESDAPGKNVPPLPPEEALAQIRMLLRTKNVSVASILELADLLTNQPDRYSEEEKSLIAILKKATTEASVIQQGKLSGFRNTLIILAGELKRVPEWLYLENPFVSLVQIPKPSKPERMTFIRNFIRPSGNSKGFNGGDTIPVEKLESACEEMADLTEGFQTMDLEALRLTSHTANIRLCNGEIRRLVDYFKFGLREDPWEKLDDEKVKMAPENLSRRVIGQPRAVDSVVTMLTSGKIGISMTNTAGGGKPRGIFFFVGPTGVGKTELAKSLTELVFGDERAFARFDMSEYKEEHAAEKLAGAPPGFVGYDEGGQLTNRVISQPHSILLFDEIEKANPRVLDKFLQILEDGRLTDGKGQTAYFNQTAIVFTSNIGASDLTEPSTGHIIREGIMKKVQEKGAAAFSYEQVEKHFRSEVEFFFSSRIGRAELLSRLGDNIVVFDILRPDFVCQISNKFLQMLKKSAQEKYHLELVFGPSVSDFMLKLMNTGHNLLYGGRRIKTFLETYIERPLNKWLFEKVKNPASLQGKSIVIDLTENGEFNAQATFFQEQP
ncbi:MAG: ATP-dependent Clp protease ATP-binding subunit [Candidatus Riflebacteria bacterium]|nr:ATP-dependent Clp protease ATP-binding subunit [Candidatus Riflebacteria bacterium]